MSEYRTPFMPRDEGYKINRNIPRNEIVKLYKELKRLGFIKKVKVKAK